MVDRFRIDSRTDLPGEVAVLCQRAEEGDAVVEVLVVPPPLVARDLDRHVGGADVLHHDQRAGGGHGHADQDQERHDPLVLAQDALGIEPSGGDVEILRAAQERQGRRRAIPRTRLLFGGQIRLGSDQPETIRGDRRATGTHQVERPGFLPMIREIRLLVVVGIERNTTLLKKDSREMLARIKRGAA